MAIAVDEVRLLIEAALPGAEVDVVDETGTSDHLKATVTAPQFEGKTRIDQHRMVKKACPGPLRRRLDPRPVDQYVVTGLAAVQSAGGSSASASASASAGFQQ